MQYAQRIVIADDTSYLNNFRRNIRTRYTSHEELNRTSIEFVMDEAHVTRRTAEAYLARFRGDPVEAVMCLTLIPERPIPEFEHRERPPLAEPYVSPMIRNRINVNMPYLGPDTGYESN